MKKAVSLLMCLIFAASFAIACTPKTELRQVRLNEVTRSVFYAPLYVAVSRGFFEDEGMDVTIETGGGSDKSMTALLAGEADVALMGPETIVYVANEGKEDHPMIIGQLTKRDGSFLVSRENEKEFNWENLRGKTVIGGRRGGMPLMTLEYVMKQHGLTPGEDVTVIDNIQFNLMGGAFEGGTGDYVTLFEPTATTFEQAGKGYVVANVGLESGEVPYTTFMVSQSTIKDDAKFVKSFVKAIYNAFIIPYDKMREVFRSEQDIQYIGFAKSTWKDNTEDHELIPTFLIDLKHVVKTWSRLNHGDDVEYLIGEILFHNEVAKQFV